MLAISPVEKVRYFAIICITAARSIESKSRYIARGQLRECWSALSSSNKSPIPKNPIRIHINCWNGSVSSKKVSQNHVSNMTINTRKLIKYSDEERYLRACARTRITKNCEQDKMAIRIRIKRVSVLGKRKLFHQKVIYTQDVNIIQIACARIRKNASVLCSTATFWAKLENHENTAEVRAIMSQSSIFYNWINESKSGNSLYGWSNFTEPMCHSFSLIIRSHQRLSNILLPCLSSHPQGSFLEFMVTKYLALLRIFSQLYFSCRIGFGSHGVRISENPDTKMTLYIGVLIFSRILRINGQPEECHMRIVSLS
jgi:hypothetical protein